LLRAILAELDLTTTYSDKLICLLQIAGKNNSLALSVAANSYRFSCLDEWWGYKALYETPCHYYFL